MRFFRRDNGVIAIKNYNVKQLSAKTNIKWKGDVRKLSPNLMEKLREWHKVRTSLTKRPFYRNSSFEHEM